MFLFSNLTYSSEAPPVGLSASSPLGDGSSLRIINDAKNGGAMPDKNELTAFNYDEDAFGNDDAILIFEPEQDLAGTVDAHPGKSRLLGILDGQPIYNETDNKCTKHTKLISVAKSRSTPKKRKKVTEEIGTARKKNIDEEELSSRLKVLILADEQLYMRILRYEVSREAHMVEVGLKADMISMTAIAFRYFLESGQGG